MLAFLGVKASERKLRLFATACCRRVWRDVADPGLARALDYLERLADGRVAKKDRTVIQRAALDAANAANQRVGRTVAARRRNEAEHLIGLELFVAGSKTLAGRAADLGKLAATAAGAGLGPAAKRDAEAAERTAQAGVARDLIGNPFHPVAIDPAWLTWNDCTVQKLAQAIYDDRAFDRMAILADALEESGCTGADILNHCRQPGEHVRGCWVIDRLLGKS